MDYVIVNGQLYCVENNYLTHYGVKGMKWGVKKAVQYAGNVGRRIGSGLTKSGQQISKVSSRLAKVGSNKQVKQPTTHVAERQAKIAKAKKAVKIGTVVAGTALAVYGAKKLNDLARSRNYERGLREIQKIQRAHDLSYQRYWLSQNRHLISK